MFRRTARVLTATAIAGAIGIGCDDGKEETTAKSVEHALAERVPPPAPQPAPPPEPAASIEPPKEIVVPEWVDEYATELCKRVGVCREKMLAAVPAQQKTMLAMQIPSQEACFKNTRTFSEKAPKAELDTSEKKAFVSCLAAVPSTACGNIQTGKVPECQAIADLISEAQGRPEGQP